MHRVATQLTALAALLLIACHSHLTAMQRLDLLVSAAQQLCPKGALVNPTSAKTLNCRRADTCLRPVAAAQHAHQDALLAMSRMEDSAGLRLAAEAATAGAIASCRVVGIVSGAAPAVPVAPTVPTAPANPVPAATPTPAPVVPAVVPVVPTPTPAPASTPAPAPAAAPQPAQPTVPTAPTPAP